MDKLSKLGLMVLTAGQLMSCGGEKKSDNKTYLDNEKTYIQNEYFQHDPINKKAVRVIELKNDSLNYNGFVKSPAIPVRYDDSQGPVTDSIHPNIFGRYYDSYTKWEGRIHFSVPAHIEEFKEWRYNRQIIVGNDTAYGEVYKKELVRSLGIR